MTAMEQYLLASRPQVLLDPQHRDRVADALRERMNAGRRSAVEVWTLRRSFAVLAAGLLIFAIVGNIRLPNPAPPDMTAFLPDELQRTMQRAFSSPTNGRPSELFSFRPTFRFRSSFSQVASALAESQSELNDTNLDQ